MLSGSSATHRWFGAVAVKSRPTRLRGRKAASSLVAVRRGLSRTAPASPRSLIRYSTLQRAHADALTVEPRPHLIGAAHPEVVRVHPGNVHLGNLVKNRPGRRRPPLGRPVGGKGELQSPADRLDPELVAIRGDESDYLLGPSSSAAKRAEAIFRISLARRN